MSEHYIPCSRSRLINLCVESSLLSESDRSQFQQLCQILLAFVHHKEQQTLENLKDLYVGFDPDAEQFQQTENTDANRLIESFSQALENANYKRINEDEIQETLNQASLIPVQTSVDFSVYKQYRFYYRQRSRKEIIQKSWFRKKTLSFDSYARMVVLLETQHGIEETEDDETLRGDKIYLYLYKNIPHFDLEMLFPSLKISMTLRDKLMLIIPALGAAIPLMLKVIPSLALLLGAVAFFTFGLDLGTGFDAGKQDDKAIYALLTAVLSVGIALGGFAVQQYIKYKSKRLSFLKQVTDVLFFKCLDTGSGVIHKVIDAAEEELCKEMILVLHVLSTAERAMTEKEIDVAIEAWIKTQLDIEMDFDVEKALSTLLTLNQSEDIHIKGLIKKDSEDRYSMHSLSECKSMIDKLWDNVFQYNQP